MKRFSVAITLAFACCEDSGREPSASAPATEGSVREQEASPATYPLTSFLDWTESTQCDLTVPYYRHPLTNPSRTCAGREVGIYNFQAGILGVVNRAADRYPQHLASLDANRLPAEVQALYDSLLHNRPLPPYDHYGDVGHPSYMPDWDHDGTFGSPGDFDADTDGDPHASSPADDTAYFRYPCATQDGGILYEDADGHCVEGISTAVLKLGVAREVKVVNARGMVLDATVWIPGEALQAGACPASGSAESLDRAEWLDCARSGSFVARTFPGVVFANGLSSRQEHYYWFAERMAREGFVALTYDPAGQAESEGTWTDLFGILDRNRACGQFAGACRDAMDMVRWFTGAGVPDARGQLAAADRLLARRNPETDNPENPAAPILDTRRVSLAGHSMGAISTLNYLNSRGMDPEGKALPPLASAISMSGAGAAEVSIPIQFQTSDYDGSPSLVGPSVAAVNLGTGGDGIGYNLIKQRYNMLRDDPSRTAAMELVVIEGGVHTDHTAVPIITRALWATALASDYAADWLQCHGGGDTSRCQSAIGPRPHISRAFASEHVEGGSTASRCIRVPDRGSLNQPPADLVAAWLQGKHVCDCVGTTAGRTCGTPPTFMP